MALVRVVLTLRQVEALIRALDEFVPRDCVAHEEHGSGEDCEGWDPRGTENLYEARDILYEAIP